MGACGEVEKGEEEYIRELSVSAGRARFWDLLGIFTGAVLNGLGVLWEIVRAGVSEVADCPDLTLLGFLLAEDVPVVFDAVFEAALPTAVPAVVDEAVDALSSVLSSAVDPA